MTALFQWGAFSLDSFVLFRKGSENQGEAFRRGSLCLCLIRLSSAFVGTTADMPHGSKGTFPCC